MSKRNEGGTALLDSPIAAVGGGKDEQRLTLVLSTSAYTDLTNIAREKRTTRADIMRLALGLMKVAYQEGKAGHKLVVATPTGTVIKELILPG